MPRNPTRWVGLPAADRRAERRTLLLDAAFELLGTEGSSGTSVRAVCLAARLNPRYFYESFDDLDALVVAVYDRLTVELRVEIEKAVATATTLEDVVRATVASTVRFIDSDRRRGQVLYVEALGNEALNRRRIEASFAVADLITAGSRDASHQLAAAFVVGGFSEVLRAWLAGRIKISRTRLIDQTTDLVLAIGR